MENLTEKKLRHGSADGRDGKALILLFGRHGDIKPQNILWFPDTSNSWMKGRGRGTLKLADFGVADFSTKDEFDSDFDRIRHQFAAQSPTYRSPENDFNDPRIGSSYDIWSLGCVYLEFIAWWFGRWKLVKKFTEERKSPDLFWTEYKGLSTPIILDTFFESKRNELTQKMEATTKSSVSQASKVVQILKSKHAAHYSSSSILWNTTGREIILRMAF